MTFQEWWDEDGKEIERKDNEDSEAYAWRLARKTWWASWDAAHGAIDMWMSNVKDIGK